MHKLKALGLVLAVAVSLVAASAPSASATATSADWRAEDGTYPESISGTSSLGSLIWGFEAGTVECAVQLSGSLTEASSKLALGATFTECKSFGFLSATVNTQSCSLSALITTKTGADSYQAHVDVVCPSGSSIKFETATCKWEVKAQTDLTTATLENMTAATPNDVTVKYELTGIAYTVTEDGPFCPFNGTGDKTGGSMKSTSNPPTLTAPGGLEIG